LDSGYSGLAISAAPTPRWLGVLVLIVMAPARWRLGQVAGSTNGFTTATPNRSKSRRLRVTTVSQVLAVLATGGATAPGYPPALHP